MSERNLARWFARALLAVGIVGLIARSSDVFGTAARPDASVWDQIFAATEVVAAARLAVILGCIYLAVRSLR